MQGVTHRKTKGGGSPISLRGASEQQHERTHGRSHRGRTSSAVRIAGTVFFVSCLFAVLFLIHQRSVEESQRHSNAAAVLPDSHHTTRIRPATKVITLGKPNDVRKDDDQQQVPPDEQRIIQEPQKEPQQALGNDDTNKYSAVNVLNESLPPTVKIIPMANDLDTCESTIVTGYFLLRSKFAPEEYLKWMKNFLSVQDCLVIFSSANMMDNLKELRQHAPTRTVLIQLEINDLPISHLHKDYSNNSLSFWQNQLDVDYEKKRHKSFELFWIWLSKSWCVVRAIDQNFFGSEYFMWQDIGSFRNGKYNGMKILQHVDVIPPKTLLWMAHHPPNAPPNPIWNDKRSEGQYYFHSGSQGAGSKDAWLEYHQKFAETMDMFLAKDMFIGEDQCVLQGTCQRFPDLCAYVPANQVNDNHYFGLRYVLVRGGSYNFWRMPGAANAR
mmetsp:Transcript_17255/g.32725  ORF Transcript_17255/g.32725 Transcript_17255/m.32725 type:complete len:440 (-) Transcript_17255:2765-4084(-)|eukprot:scaffold34622_cov162-Amphora_coffeaeformis.AAC.1